MNKFFELRENFDLLYGIIKNIPEDTTIDEIKNRIEIITDNVELILVDKLIDNKLIDIEMDWIEIDYIGGLDPDFIVVTEILEQSNNLSIENKVVFSALSKLKEDNTQSISEVIKNSFDELK